MKLVNPILPGFYPDPSCVPVCEDYYLVTSSFEYFPGVPLWHSRDLVNWKQIGHCLTRASQLPLEGSQASRGIWAPTIRHHDGRFYMITTNMHQGGHFFVTALDPAGEWSEPTWLPGDGWDSSLFFDDDGKVYYSWFEIPNRVLQAELDLASGQLLSEPHLVWNGTGMRSPEAPHLYKFFGKYYLMVAEGGTEYGHSVAIARSESPWGPFESCPWNPLISHRSLDNPIQATGHGDLFQAHDGSWWLVFLGIRPVWYPPRHHLGRETFLAPVRWVDGFPVVGMNGRIQRVMAVDCLPPKPWSADESEALREDFDQPKLALHWNYLRNPREWQYSLNERPGWLRLKGSAETIMDEASPAFVGRRQRHFYVQVETLLDFEPREEGEEAGISAFMNHKHHYEIALQYRGGERRLIFRRQIGTLKAIEAEKVLPPGAVKLFIEADKLWYRFGFIDAQGAGHQLGQGEVQYLTTEVGGAFTGVYLAMYAFGAGKASPAPADFDYFHYTVLREDYDEEDESMLEVPDLL